MVLLLLSHWTVILRALKTKIPFPILSAVTGRIHAIADAQQAVLEQVATVVTIQTTLSLMIEGQTDLQNVPPRSSKNKVINICIIL